MLTIRTLHPWTISPREAIALQKRLAIALELRPLPEGFQTRYIAGLDVSSSRFDPMLTAGVVVWDSQTESIVETAFAKARSAYPYIPGLLSFREIPVLLEALQQLKMVPDIFFVDGQGIAHPRRLGIAAHLGLLVDQPTIGVGKSKLIGSVGELLSPVGSSAPLMDGDEQIGVVLRTKERSNPLYISPGNHVDMETAVTLVHSALRGYKLPEPTRLAHIYVNAMRTDTLFQPVLTSKHSHVPQYGQSSFRV
jgi:deoxyribonuclease V